MKKCLSFLIFLLPFTVVAQSAFTISAPHVPFKNGDKIYLVYRVKEAKYADSTVVTNNAFSFKGTVNGLGIGYICRNDNPFTADFLYDSSDIYIEPGNITIATVDSMNNASITGTTVNQDYSDLSIALRQLSRQATAINNYYDALSPAQQADVNVLGDVRARLKMNSKQMEPIKFAFIKTHPDAYISIATLNRMVNNADIADVEKAFKDLTPAIKNTELGQSTGKLITSAKQSALGVMAVNFTLPNPSGKLVKVSDFRGKYLLVDFWASWCLPCREENPNVRAAYEKYKAKGFIVLSVSIDDENSKAAWLKAIKNDKLPWPQVLDNFEPSKKVKSLYGITTIPANVLLDPTGKIIAKNLKDKALQDTLAGLFKEK